jgi:hypothetical protein
MKVNMKPVGDFVGEGRVYKVRSSSNPFLWHFTLIMDCPDDYSGLSGKRCAACDEERETGQSVGQHDKRLYDCPTCNGKGWTAVCSCTGFNTHGHCWHTEEIGAWDRGITPDEEQTNKEIEQNG